MMPVPELRSYASVDSDRVFLRRLAAQLTGDLDTARNGFEQAVDVYIHSSDPATALEPLRHAREWRDNLFSGYAGYLEGHVLIGQGRVRGAAPLGRSPPRAPTAARGLAPTPANESSSGPAVAW